MAHLVAGNVEISDITSALHTEGAYCKECEAYVAVIVSYLAGHEDIYLCLTCGLQDLLFPASTGSHHP